MRTLFFPLNSEAEIVEREFRIAQEFGIYEEDMLVSRFMWLSDKVLAVRKAKVEAMQKGETYIGG